MFQTEKVKTPIPARAYQRYSKLVTQVEKLLPGETLAIKNITRSEYVWIFSKYRAIFEQDGCKVFSRTVDGERTVYITRET